MASPEEPAPVVFRPAKRRKDYRHRSERDDEAAADGASTAAAAAAIEAPATIAAPGVTSPGNDDADEESGLSVAQALQRARNARKHRFGGVTFRAGPSHAGDDDHATEENPEQRLVVRDGADSMVPVGGITTRFAPQTGLVGELVNKHMEEYVESELAKRQRLRAGALSQNQNTGQDGSARHDPGTEASQAVPGKSVESQRVMQGKLLEVDLGDEARARAAEMTERAKRRLQGLAAEEEIPEKRPKKVRLGPDGKPWRSRNRRGSDDLKRDELVEKLMSENRLEVYDLESNQAAPEVGFENEEQFAEEFRREFMENMSQNRRRRAVKPTGPVKPGAKKEDEILKGPKLGGSRNARAAMRNILLKEQEEKKKRR
ncbi:hepatocellular carcinoma-associated antigen 59-domain-containing protein [Echria macrotheca]|uniref:Hepatocellular carcinoma-associated antigen 59-domain-containing protein n=1 Tax=Echria macrotheca TaxID=438768 RepID=A0AAJ0BGL5_9PEZI|nr:hepatocellular carcinoma-associated antigen 59-domain-containing protein [Echria macrotheca]